MSIGSDIFTTLKTLVSNRVYPAGDVPAGTDPDYITYQRVGAARANSLGGDSHLSNQRVQVDIWSATYAGAQSLKESARTAMSAASFRPLLLSDSDEYESETGLHRVIMDYSIWIND